MTDTTEFSEDDMKLIRKEKAIAMKAWRNRHVGKAELYQNRFYLRRAKERAATGNVSESTI